MQFGFQYARTRNWHAAFKSSKGRRRDSCWKCNSRNAAAVSLHELMTILKAFFTRCVCASVLDQSQKVIHRSWITFQAYLIFPNIFHRSMVSGIRCQAQSLYEDTYALHDKKKKKVARQHPRRNSRKICRKQLILILLIYSFGHKTWNNKNIGKIKRNLLPRLALFGYILSSRGLTDEKKKLFRIILQIYIITHLTSSTLKRKRKEQITVLVAE